MFQPLECFIAWRYVRARRHRGFASFITIASVLGMALGVASLIVVLSVMNGLETELRDRLLSMTAHVTIANPQQGIEDWQSLGTVVAEQPGVSGVSPFVLVEGMLGSGSNLSPAVVRGIVPAEEIAVSQIDDFMRSGSLSDLEAGAQRIILGRLLALNLGVGVGDRVNLLVPKIDAGRPTALLRSFLVSGTFVAGVQTHDAGLAFVHMEDASELRGLNGRAAGVSLRLDDPMLTGELARTLPLLIDGAATYSDWTIENSSHFRAIRIEKTMMAVLLTLIVAVAAFNIVASLVMVVTDKKKDIAILRTYGLDAKRVARIFMVQGSIIGCSGTLLGLILGIVLALNVETVFPWLERTFNFQLMPGDVFYVTQLPSELQWFDVTVITLTALAIGVLATIYPSRRAASVAPADALRYE
jgi:lipoprotein-releasing system permease protein